MKRTAWLAMALAVVMVAGCQVPPPLEPVEVAPSAASIGEDLAPVALDRVQFALRRGQVIGEYIDYGQWWVGCAAEEEEVVWAGTRTTVQDEDLAAIFHEELSAAGYRVVGDTGELFADTAAFRDEPDFLIGGRVDNLQMNICRESDGYSYSGGISGDARISVTWQVFSLLEARVVYETMTEGYTKHEESTLEGDYLMIADAFAAAAANLAADKRFHALLAEDTLPAADTESAALSPMQVATSPPLAGGVENNILKIDRAVVTILLGDGHGSGFFITPALLLTNHHVAGNRDRVRVRLNDGSEVIGRVVRSDAARDVALVEVDEALAGALPLRIGLPNRAETVYAVGSPDDTGLAGTITRGIVSQVRTDERGLDWIQADVDIHPGSSGGPLLDEAGNVVGIAAWARVAPDGTTKGLNFFVPIGDALRALAVRLTGSS